MLAEMKYAQSSKFEERARLRVVAVELDDGVTGDDDIADGDTCAEPPCSYAEPSCSTLADALVDCLNLTRLSMMLQARLPRCTLQTHYRCPAIRFRARP